MKPLKNNIPGILPLKTVAVISFLFVLFISVGRACAQDKSAAAPPDSAKTDEEATGFTREQMLYKSDGKRDPFGSLVPVEPEAGKTLKGLFNYERAELRGIVKTGDDIYALVIDANNFAHVLREGYMIYGGYVTSITDNSVFLHIVKYGRSMSIVLSLESSKSTVVSEEDDEMIVKKPGITISYKQSSQPQKKIHIEDILLPSTETKTLDELWFGGKSSLPVVRKSFDTTGDQPLTSFSLFAPPRNSWIKLPYEMNWTDGSGEGVTYIITIDDEQEFNAPHVVMEQVRDSSYLIVEDMDLPLNRQLYWKVVAVDESGNEKLCRQSFLTFKIAGNN